MEDNNNNNINQINEYVNCKASDIVRLLKTKIDRKNIAKELSKKIYNFFRFIFSTKRKRI